MNTRVYGAAVVRPLLMAMVCLAAGAATASAQNVASSWASVDVGGPALAGSATATSASAFTVSGAGIDIWNGSDQFHFVYQAVTGDVDIRARVDSVTYTHAWAKAGVMIRASLEPHAPHALALASAGKGLAFQRRTAAGALSTHTAGELAAPPRWVRLVRQGTRVTAYTSATGTSWTEVGSDTIAIRETAYVGLAVTSHNTAARATAQFSNVAVTTQALPAGQVSMDIGAPALAGSVAHADGSYTVKAAGADIWSAADQFHFVYQPLTGDGTVLARVAALQYIHRWTKAGVMIRESLGAGARHASAFVTPGMGYAFQWRSDTGALSDHLSGTAGSAPGWVALVRKGTTITGYQSTDGQTWRAIGTAAIPMTQTVYVGIALTSHDTGATATAVVDRLQVTQDTAEANRPPVVNLTAPVAGASYTAPASVALAASASDPEGRMSAVEFYSGSTLLGRDTTAPYALSWPSVPAGTYTITAVAYDAEGASGSAPPVSISVTTASTTTAPRYAAFMASADHETAVTSYRLAVYASGADPATATPIATSDLGKPSPSSTGEIVVERAAFFAALAPGSYVAAVSAVGPGGAGQSAAVTFTR